MSVVSEEKVYGRYLSVFDRKVRFETTSSGEVCGGREDGACR
jgi:hypothetical protein